MLVNAKIKRFVTFGTYADDSFMGLFQEAGIEFKLHKKPPTGITHLP
jgi:dCMP deaminase